MPKVKQLQQAKEEYQQELELELEQEQEQEKKENEEEENDYIQWEKVQAIKLYTFRQR